MATPFDIPLTDRMSEDLVQFLDNRQKLPIILETALSCDPASSMLAFAGIVAKTASISIRDTLPTLNILWNLRRFQEVRGESPADVVDGLTAAISKKVGGRWWTEERMKLWSEFRGELVSALERITSDTPLMISSKAQYLTYQRERILSDTRVITDIRPVFSDDANTIREMVVTHSLILEYVDDGADKTIFITLDMDDLKKLTEQCSRAGAKSRVIVESMQDMPWRTVVFPENP